MRALPLALAAAMLCGTAAGAQVRDLATRPHATVRTLVLAPAERPRAAAVLLVGGPGVANIPARVAADWERDGSFLVRTRALFRDRGVYTVLMDAPSDHRFGLGSWRFSAEHAADVVDVIADARRHAGAPVWLVATSAGTVSAVNAAMRYAPPRGPDGLVLTSAVARTLPDMDLASVRVPVLLVQHRDDACTPLWAAEPLPGLFASSPRVEMQLFSGGGGPRPDACAVSSPHSFYGLDEEVVAAIVAWMGGN